MLDLWEKNVHPFLSFRILAAQQSQVSWSSKCFQMVKCVDRRPTSQDSSAMKLCCSNRCSMLFSIVYARASYVALYLWALMVLFQMCNFPVPYTLMHLRIIGGEGFWPGCWLQANDDAVCMISKKKVDSSDHRTVFYCFSVQFKWALAERRLNHVHDGASFCSCGWHGDPRFGGGDFWKCS